VNLLHEHFFFPAAFCIFFVFLIFVIFSFFLYTIYIVLYFFWAILVFVLNFREADGYIFVYIHPHQHEMQLIYGI